MHFVSFPLPFVPNAEQTLAWMAQSIRFYFLLHRSSTHVRERRNTNLRPKMVAEARSVSLGWIWFAEKSSHQYKIK